MIRTVLHISDTAAKNTSMHSRYMIEIESISKIKNKINQIRGILMEDGRHFFHMVEGRSSDVEQLLKKIEKDHRNKNFTVIFDLYSPEHLYDRWESIDSPSDQQRRSFNMFLKTNLDALVLLGDREFNVLDKFVRKHF